MEGYIVIIVLTSLITNIQLHLVLPWNLCRSLKMHSNLITRLIPTLIFHHILVQCAHNATKLLRKTIVGRGLVMKSEFTIIYSMQWLICRLADRLHGNTTPTYNGHIHLCTNKPQGSFLRMLPVLTVTDSCFVSYTMLTNMGASTSMLLILCIAHHLFRCSLLK